MSKELLRKILFGYKKTADIIITVESSQCDKSLSIPIFSKCIACEATGHRHSIKSPPCRICDGKNRQCFSCNGSRKEMKDEDKCFFCYGLGVQVTDTLFTLSGNTKEKTSDPTIRFKGQGHETLDAERGDVVFHITNTV